MRSIKHTERALKEIIEYRKSLIEDTDEDLASALDHVVAVVQNHLYHAFLDVREFYETALLPNDIPLKEKVNMAHEIAMRWEQIDSSSAGLSTVSLLDRPGSTNVKESNASEHHRNSLCQMRPQTDLPHTPNLMHPFRGMRLDSYQNNNNNNKTNNCNDNSNDSPLFDDSEEVAVVVRAPRQQLPSSRINHMVDTERPRSRRSNQTRQLRMDASLCESSKKSFVEMQQKCRRHQQQKCGVQLARGSRGFGFSIAGGADQDPVVASQQDPRFVFVARITPGGVADVDGRLKVNDKILSVNGIDLVGVPHFKAVEIFENAGSYLELIVEHLDEAVFPSPSLSCDSRRFDRSTNNDNITSNASDEMRSLETSAPIAPTCRKTVSVSNSSTFSDLPLGDMATETSITNLPSISSLFSPSSRNGIKELSGSSRDVNPRQENTGDCGDDEEDDKIWFLDPLRSSISSKRRSISSFKSDLSGRITNQNVSRENNLSQESSRLRIDDRMHRSDYQISPLAPKTGTTMPMPKPLSNRPLPIPPLGPVIVEVPLVRGTRNGFGFSIAGGIDNEFIEGDSGVFITQIALGGVADTSGRVTVGDRLVRVNSASLVNVTHEAAVTALQGAGEFALIVLIKASNQSSPQRTSCHACQTASRSLGALNVSTSPGRDLNYHNLHNSLDIGPRSKRPTPTGKTPTVTPIGNTSTTKKKKCPKPALLQILPSPDTGFFMLSQHRQVERILKSNELEGPAKYAATLAVSDSILKRWPDARLVTLYKESVVEKPEMIADPARSGGGGTLGFNIIGGEGTDGIFVSYLQPNRPAFKSRAVSVGDRLLVINGVEVADSSHEEAAILLKSAPVRVDLVLAFVPDEYKSLEEHMSVNEFDGDDALTNKANQNNSVSAKKKHNTLALEASGLFVRVLADFDPGSVANTGQVIPKLALQIRSGDILQLVNTADSEWWQAKLIHPSTCKPLGAVGLVPSRTRLERLERERLHCKSLQGKSKSQHIGSRNFRRTKRKSSSSSTSSSRSLLSSSSASSVNNRSTEENIKSLPVSPKDANIANTSSFKASSTHRRRRSSSNRLIHHHANSNTKRRNQSNDSAIPRRKEGTPSDIESSSFMRPLTYVPVTFFNLSYARPVVILGDLKDNIADDLLSDFPNDFGICVPFTTRQRRKGEVEGRDYHFVKSRSKMESEIGLHRYIEAGEYNGNLYGTHIQSVFKVAATDLHCLLDVGGPALERLTAIGLPPIALFVHAPNQGLQDHTVHLLNLPRETGKSGDVNDEDVGGNAAADDDDAGDDLLGGQTSAANQIRQARVHEKTNEFLRHFSAYLTAVVSMDDYEKTYGRIQELIEDNKGPQIWIASNETLP